MSDIYNLSLYRFLNSGELFWLELNYLQNARALKTRTLKLSSLFLWFLLLLKLILYSTVETFNRPHTNINFTHDSFSLSLYLLLYLIYTESLKEMMRQGSNN